MDTQKLIMYLVQCRKDDFIDCFEHLTNTFRGHLNVSMYDYPLFTIAASLKTLLNEEYSSGVFRKAKENMTGIWEYLERKGYIPECAFQSVVNFGKQTIIYDENDSVESILGYPVETFERYGIRTIDCELYKAGVTFNFSEVEKLLALGANPDVDIPCTLPPTEDDEETDDCWNLTSHLSMYWYDVFEPCEHILDTWENGINKVDEEIEDSYLYQIVCSAVHKMMLDFIEERRSQ